MCQHGMQTSADTPGVERLVVSALQPDVGCQPKHRFDSAQICGDRSLLEPGGVLFVKGWSRSVCMRLLLRCAYEKGDDFLQVGLERQE